MKFGIDETLPFKPLGMAVLTISDTRTSKTDTSGDRLAGYIRETGHKLVTRDISRDDVETIRGTLKTWIAREDINVILTTGGTGFTRRDVTPSAVRPLYDKEIDGFSVLFHQISYTTVGTSTIQSRACAGLCGTTLVFSLPGSPGACKDGWNGILKYQLDARHKPCNFVQILEGLESGRF